MASYSPTITINSTPAIQVTMVGAITYQEFQNIVGTYVFGIDEIFLEALSTRQINQPITYNIYNPNGNSFQQPLTPKVDPYQYRASLRLPTKGEKFILNGFSSLGFIILTGETLSLFLYSQQVSVQDFLKTASSVNNFNNVPDKLGNLKIYMQKKQ